MSKVLICQKENVKSVNYLISYTLEYSSLLPFFNIRRLNYEVKKILNYEENTIYDRKKKASNHKKDKRKYFDFP